MATMHGPGAPSVAAVHGPGGQVTARTTYGVTGPLNQENENDGPSHFKCPYFSNGKIHFAYRKLPLLWNELNNDDHPVEVGIADAFYLEVPRESVKTVV